jgi:hypothetical protein
MLYCVVKPTDKDHIMNDKIFGTCKQVCLFHTSPIHAWKFVLSPFSLLVPLLPPFSSLSLSPHSHTLSMNQASEAYLAGNLDEAVYYYQEAVTTSEDEGVSNNDSVG